ncbi:hypothetical protein [Pontimicrobium sp. MEBiC01747]
MSKKSIKKNIVLGILFFLPVAFLLILLPSEDNYVPLNIVKENVLGIENLPSNKDKDIVLKDHITILGFLGSNPEAKITEASNLKELIYNKFKGFKKFQVVMLVPEQAKAEAERVKQELTKYKPLKFWHFVYASESDINRLFNSLRTSLRLDGTYATNSVYIIDTELNQRGRLDDRTKKEVKENTVPAYPLTAYNCSEVSILKNKMGAEDMRVLFKEYREKRKGDFNSTSRRADDIKPNNTSDEKE